MKMQYTRSLMAAVIIALAATVQACPNCKDGLAHYDATNGRAGYSANGLQQGFSYSVMFMLGVPISMVGAGGYMVRRLARQGRLPEL